MAHFLDRTIFTAAAVALCFVITLNLTQSLLPAMLAGALAPYPLRALWRILRNRCCNSKISLRRSLRKRAAETVRCWAILRDATCRDHILALLKAAYPDSAGEMSLSTQPPNNIPVHILMTLRSISEETMADCLRRIRETSCERAVIACTADFSPEARAISQSIPHLQLAVIDGDMLTLLLTKHPDAVPFREIPHPHPQRPKLTRAHAMKMLPAAALLWGAYWLFGLPAYLPAAMALLWGILMLLKRKNAPTTLFSP